jgi:hypothetical protein
VEKVFISHASEDASAAAELQRWLVDAGHHVFLDRDLRSGIAVGDEWQPRLHERLRWADAMVCVVTSAYLTSIWCSAEVGAAQSRGSRVLPVLVEAGVVTRCCKTSNTSTQQRTAALPAEDCSRYWIG